MTELIVLVFGGVIAWMAYSSGHARGKEKGEADGYRAGFIQGADWGFWSATEKHAPTRRTMSLDEYVAMPTAEDWQRVGLEPPQADDEELIHASNVIERPRTRYDRPSSMESQHPVEIYEETVARPF